MLQKTGRWNAMHVRIAWEIFYDQQKQVSEKNSSKLGSSDLLRGPPGSASLSSSRMYSSLSRPPELGPTMIPGPGPANRIESSFLSNHITPSIPGLSRLRYEANSSSTPGTNPAFHHPGITPTTISGPPPGSMFSRDPIPTGLSLPTPLNHDAWR